MNLKYTKMNSFKETANEIWKDIPGYENVYQVSNIGRVKRLTYHKKIGYGAIQPLPEKILKSFDDSYGYNTLVLCKNAKTKHFKIHQLVCLAFLPNPENKKTVNHKNGIRNDNRVENLEWNTQSENNYHSYRVLGKVHIMPLGALHFASRAIYCIKKDGTKEFYGALSEAARFLKVNQSCISKALLGAGRTCKGRMFFYSDEKKTNRKRKRIVAIKPEIKITQTELFN